MNHPEPTPADLRRIARIAERAYQRTRCFMQPAYRVPQCTRDLIAVHTHGCPLDFRKLLFATDYDFLHDILGIRYHLDRRTGRIRNNYPIRCSKPTPRTTG